MRDGICIDEIRYDAMAADRISGSSFIRQMSAVLLLFVSTALQAQDTLFLRLLPTDADSADISAEIDWPPAQFTDSLALRAALAQVQQDLQERAYWEASIDTLVRQNRVYGAFLHRGPRYRWTALRPAADIPERWLSRAGFRRRLFEQRDLNYARWEQLQNRITLEAASDGFPFVRVGLDSIQWEGPGQLGAQLVVEKGPLVLIDGLELPEAAGIRPIYLENYTGLRPGMLYSEAKIRRLKDRLRELPFLQLQGDPSIRFNGNRATIQLPVRRKPASRFDFVIGVLPNSNQTGRLLITGELKGELINGFGRGERLAAQFEQLRPQTQELDIAFQFPYLLGLPFGLDLQANFYKRDTQYIDLGWRAAASYLWEGGSQVEVFWARQQTNLLNFDSLRILQLQRLPDTLDVRRSSFGLALNRLQLDYRFNPRRGWSINFSGSVGTKRVRRNTRLLELEGVEALYDSLDERSTQYRLELLGAYYFPLFRSSALKVGLDAGAIVADDRVFVNEQYRLGGARRLRGFDEQSIFASRFAISTLEYRFLLDQNSYFYLFGDYAYLDQQSVATPQGSNAIDWLLGFGAGITFDTRSGIFGLSLAFGRRSATAVDFGSPKVHFGYISLF